ncbi:hypothetical protein C2E23DRAFT_830977 [Lenzites betulinus]|nr:hypothetical protein C2E23DRAFT_830977 [Lenzites betulinus]
MRVSKTSRTARNFHAYAYIQHHATATTEEFARAHADLDQASIKLYNAMHEFARQRPAKETVQEVFEAFNSLTEEAQELYQNIEMKGAPAKGKGKARA